MSETTTKLRAFTTYSVGACGVRDRAADAIEAVEAQVAEVAKRHEDLAAWCAETEARVAALEKRQGVDETRSGGPLVGHAQPETPRASKGRGDATPSNPAGSQPAPAPRLLRFKPGDRVRFVKEPRCTGGYLGSFGTVESIVGWPIFFDYDIKSDTCGENGYHVKADDSDLEPAPSAVPAPRGFREGDICRVIESKRTKENFLVGCEGRINPYRGSGGDWVIDCGTAKGVRCFYNSELTLVRAADAPEAPAEDAGLVERLARIIVDTPCAANHEGQCIPPGAPVDDCDRANARAVLSDLTAESRLCAPGEVARLKDELAEANGARFLNANAVRLQKARAEAAEKELAEARAISAATAERVRNETQIATELRQDLADANDRLTSQSRSIEEMHAELAEAHKWRDDLRAKLAAAEQAHAELLKARMECASRADGYVAERDALRAEVAALKAKPRSRTRPVTAADVRALDDEWAKSKYVGRNSWVLAMNAVGFRRRVDGAK